MEQMFLPVGTGWRSNNLLPNLSFLSGAGRPGDNSFCLFCLVWSEMEYLAPASKGQPCNKAPPPHRTIRTKFDSVCLIYNGSLMRKVLANFTYVNKGGFYPSVTVLNVHIIDHYRYCTRRLFSKNKKSCYPVRDNSHGQGGMIQFHWCKIHTSGHRKCGKNTRY